MAATGIDIQLPTGHEISGRVLGPGDHPVAGVRVGLQSDTATTPDAMTGPDGGYALHGLADGTYLVQFAPPDGANLLTRWFGAPDSAVSPASAERVIVAGADESGVDARLEPGATISGTVTGDAGSVEGILVDASGPLGSSSGSVGSDGSYTIAGLPPDVYSLAIEPPPDSPYRAGVVDEGAVLEVPDAGSPVDLTGGDASGVDFAVAAGSRITGRISGGGGPVAVMASEMGGGFGASQTVVSPAGDYTLQGLWPSTYVISYTPATDPADSDTSLFPLGAYAEGVLVDATAGVAVDTTAGDVGLATVTIPVGAAVGGRVTAHGRGLSHAYVSICDVDGLIGCAATFTGADGSYRFTHVPTADWIVLASASHRVSGYHGPGGYALDEDGATAVHADASGPDVTSVDVVLPDGGTITGTVSGPDGRPAAGAILSPSGPVYPGDAPCVTASDGRYACDGLAPGAYILYVDASPDDDVLPGYYDADAPGHYTADYEQATEIDVVDLGDPTPPTVQPGGPVRNATGVVRDVVVSAQFSEAVQGVGPATFVLRVKATGRVVAGTDTYDSVTHVARLVPTALLAPATTYQVSLDTGITDAAGNPLAPVSWIFTTSTDKTAPRYSSRKPASSATGVKTTATVTIKFSEAVRGVSGTTLRVVDRKTGAAVAGTVRYTASTRTATFKPRVHALKRLRSYVVTVGTGITDLAGNPLARSTWRFSTGRR